MSVTPEKIDSDGRESTLLRRFLSAREESELARKLRMNLNIRNRDAYHSRQDWSQKIEGQSREFLPKVASTVEAFSAFVKRALVDFGQWFSAEMPKGAVVDGQAIASLLLCELHRLTDDDGSRTSIEVRVSDGVKTALLEAVMTFKITAGKGPPIGFEALGSEVVHAREGRFGLNVDLCRPEDCFPDPSGRGLYFIHETEMDLYELFDSGVYDETALGKIVEDVTRQEFEWQARKRDTGEASSTPPPSRKRVVVSEYWGTVLDANGRIARMEVDGESIPLRDVVFTFANKRHLIRKPERYPDWSGEHPFVEIPIIRVPFTKFHKALYDDGVDLNLALNELYNLILDGGLAAVWGVRELRLDWLENPSQVSPGIAQGATLLLNQNAPPGASALTQSTSGGVPNDALNVFNLTEAQFNASVLTNELRQGLLPPRQVKATEISEASRSNSMTLEAVTSDMERGLSHVLRKSWLLVAQHLDLIEPSVLVRHLGPRAALTLARATPAERFVQLGRANLEVFGLSATLHRARDFQRLMALMQVASSNPMMMHSFIRNYSPDKLLGQAFKLVNVNPERFQRDASEVSRLPSDFKEAIALFSAFGGAKGAAGVTPGSAQSPTGEPGMPSEINSQTNPQGG